MGNASSIRPGNFHWRTNVRQQGLDLETPRLEPLRKLQRLTQLVERLIYCEAGRIGRDLEEHTTRHAKLDRMEVIAVDLRCHVEALCDQLISN